MPAPPEFPALTSGGTSHELTSHAARRLAAAAITCTAILLPTAALGLEPRTHGLKVRCSAIELAPRSVAHPAHHEAENRATLRIEAYRNVSGRRTFR